MVLPDPSGAKRYALTQSDMMAFPFNVSTFAGLFHM